MASKITAHVYDNTATCGLLSADVRDAQGYALWAVNAWVALDEPGYPVQRRVQGEAALQRVAGPAFEFRDDAFAYLGKLAPSFLAEAREAASRIRAERRQARV